jgi:hypothetical protein
MSPRPIRVFLTAALLVLCSAPLFAQNFVFHLRGDQEVPPIPTAASGGCMATLNQPASQLSITCVHNVVEATLMHIHRGAAGVNGPVLFDLGDPASGFVTATWSGMLPADISDLLAGNLYVNIHTGGRPAGEIRGQMLTRTVDAVSFTATGSQHVPPSGTSATANCTADLSNDATQLAVNCTHDVPGATTATIGEAPAGTNGPAVFTFGSAASPLAANVPMTPRLVADFAATFLYLDIDTPPGTEEAPNPQIRGQIGTPPSGPAPFGTIRIVKATSPNGGSGFNFTETITAGGAFTLNDGETRTFSTVGVGTYTVTENNPDGDGYSLGDISCSDGDSSGNAAARSATIRLQAGEVVTCTFRNVLTSATDSLFIFHLDGAQEVPPVSSLAQGGCHGQFNAGASRLTMVCTHSVVGPTLMHIHRGAPGVNGPVIFDLGSPVSPVIAAWQGMTPADVADLFAGNFYINIHTAGRPAGEIRGQLLPRTVDTVSFSADGAQTVPPGSTPATASCVADLDGPATSLAINCTHSVPTPNAAHVHQGARGENGPIAFTFPSAASPLAGSMPMTPRLVADYAGSLLYLDIHGGGATEATAVEIRGQIGAAPAVVTTGTIRIIKGTSPAGGTGFSFTDNVPGSPGAFTLNDGGIRTFSNVAAGSYAINEAIAPGYTLTSIRCDDSDSTGNPFARRATVNLQAGEAVTCTFRNLQTIPTGTLFVFHLNGAQEVPPVPTAARGGCMGQLDAAAGRFSIVCTHDVTGPQMMHIHRGAAGVNGPILFDLGQPESPVQAVWSGMTPQDVADLMAGNLYINVHASGRPSGEIRGQILMRTVDSFQFGADASQEVPPSGSSASGSCLTDLSNDAASLFVQCSHNVLNPTMGHLHSAPVGVDGPIVFDFPATAAFSSNVPMNPRLVADFAAGFLYVNIHTVDFPEGEIRGQLIAGLLPSDIPTLPVWAMVMLVGILVGVAVWRGR